MQTLERDLTKLGEAYAQDDDMRSTLAYYEQWFRENGIDPWKPPTPEE